MGNVSSSDNTVRLRAGYRMGRGGDGFFAGANYRGADFEMGGAEALSAIALGVGTVALIASNNQNNANDELLRSEPRRDSQPTVQVNRETGLDTFNTYRGYQVTLYRNKTIGCGRAGTVYLSDWSGMSSPKEKFAIKVFNAPKLSNTDASFKEESDKIISFSSEYLVKYYDYTLGAPNYSLVMEHMTGGSLYELLHNEKELPWDRRWIIAMDISKGIEYLHGKNFVHRDIKSLNVLISHSGRAKLCDFGYSAINLASTSLSTRSRRSHNTTSTQSKRLRNTTLAWSAPEMLYENNPVPCSKKTDMYSYGMTLWEIGTRKIPFSEEHNEFAVLRRISNNRQESLKDIPQGGLKALIKRCWEKPERRVTIQEAVTEMSEIAKTDLRGKVPIF